MNNVQLTKMKYHHHMQANTTEGRTAGIWDGTY